MLKYTDLFTPYHIAVLVDWLEEKGELCLEIYLPHSGGGASYETVRSLAELKQRVDAIEWPEVIITVWKNHGRLEFETDPPFPLADDLRWIYFHSDEVMYFAVQKNRNWSEPFHSNAGKYSRSVEEWHS